MRSSGWVTVVGAIVVLLIIAVGAVYALSAARFGKAYLTAVEAVAIPTDAASLARGKHLVEAVGKCQACHGDNYAGTKMFDDPIPACLCFAGSANG